VQAGVAYEALRVDVGVARRRLRLGVRKDGTDHRQRNALREVARRRVPQLVKGDLVDPGASSSRETAFRSVSLK
jgi:hypothetical protein